MVRSFVQILGVFVKIFARYGVLLLALLLLVSLTRNIYRVISARERLVEARHSLEVVRREQVSLEEDLRMVQSDFFKERQARDKLGLSREGEQIVILPDEEILKRLSPRVNKKEQYSLPDPIWRQWVNLFVGS